MGKQPSKNKKAKFPGHLSNLTWDRFYAYIAREHGFTSEEAIRDLDEELTGLALRDQRILTKTAETQQRRDAYKVAKRIRRIAQIIGPAFKELRERVAEFEEIIADEGH